MEEIRAIIIEDEKPAIEELKYVLSKYNFLNVVDVAMTGDVGYELVKKLQPEVVFMDINIPTESGMSVSKKIKEFNKDINIIFITAYEKYALEAFEIEALDYILKPFDDKRIDLTIKRLKEKIEQKHSEKIPDMISNILNKLEKEEKSLKKIPCEYRGKIILIDTKDIHYCYTMEEKTYVKADSKEYITHNTLKEIEKKTDLVRVHRSYIVNMDNIKELYSWFNGTYKLVMDDKEQSEIPVSRNNVKKLKETLGI
ncbi:LytTR family DNA-binding domain-containing protein [Clostridium sporogenes]|uniref:Stage 0 sporulation protein A homolog n=1 Tax=Clostridium botulinum TaxID=1491 RepID=A0A6M0SV50_CLOBO|nr:LytTR family DNA-binding domain-containing protein [Clostridium sporogenes]NFA59428.1 response regulator transcription factor [Clostridium botulinum]NFI74612.1 response regulator transcription factor [Clostridium sporogenes]NFL71253.1 response regulator transcription factor [Clostridium sporogenes]NFM25746.1 response regulator transcription factor [Clostridium sporogenes]NFP62526.1 response regulator transcription factor [Clostridium sporogenes]